MAHIVETTSGKLEGARLVSDVGADIHRFLGVPFAAPPVGPLRFRAPQPMRPWAGVRSAQVFGPSAPQLPGLMRDLPAHAEDCLYLNVWTPGIDGARRPVLLWVHGGGFTSGAGSQTSYDGERLARFGDVVVVTINYRLGVLGFTFLEQLLSEYEQLVESANPGLRDQLAALAWVRQNIEYFGGDPDNVTIFGESAGAMCLSTLLSVSRAEGLFQRAIAQSGAAEHCIVAEDATAVAAALLGALGGTPARPEVLWEAPLDALLSQQAACVRHQVRRGHPGDYHAVRQLGTGVVADGALVPTDVRAAIRRGTVSVPLLIGTNAEEWHFYVHLSDRGKLALDEAGLREVCERRAKGVGNAAVSHYLSLPAYRGRAPWEVFSAIEGDRAFRMPALRLAEYQGRHAPVFTYLFDRPSPLFDGRMGACHSVEIPYVFGTLDTPFGRSFCGYDARGEALSQMMMEAWLRFARAGAPGQVAGQAWERYETGQRWVMRLGDRIALEPDPDAGMRAFWPPE